MVDLTTTTIFNENERPLRVEIDLHDHTTIRAKMLNWIARFNIFVFLDNPPSPTEQSGFRVRAAVGAKHRMQVKAVDAFPTLHRFRQAYPGWCFGHIGFDVKNALYPGLSSAHPSSMAFPDMAFFQPEWILELYPDKLIITGEGDALRCWDEIQACDSTIERGYQSGEIAARVKPSLSREAYIKRLEQLHQHIQRGDCYEINYCQEFGADDVFLNPVGLYEALVQHSPNPFSVCYRWEDQYCIGASPERFLRKVGSTVWSQPIKGTSRRNIQEPSADEASKQALLHSEKERAENVMVVDLVRNDLSRTCLPGSVQVDELFGIYSFPQVHQMISTVRGELMPDKSILDVLETCFPMGSMTGAPKKRVLELIEEYETFQRGLFSGTIGYLSPNDDGDFNVVIRSIFYRADTHQLRFATGSGITRYADPAAEYEECLLKAEAIKAVL